MFSDVWTTGEEAYLDSTMLWEVSCCGRRTRGLRVSLRSWGIRARHRRRWCYKRLRRSGVPIGPMALRRAPRILFLTTRLGRVRPGSTRPEKQNEPRTTNHDPRQHPNPAFEHRRTSKQARGESARSTRRPPTQTLLYLVRLLVSFVPEILIVHTLNDRHRPAPHTIPTSFPGNSSAVPPPPHTPTFYSPQPPHGASRSTCGGMGGPDEGCRS